MCAPDVFHPCALRSPRSQQSDDYVLNAVILATVLFLTANAERFEWNTVSAVVLALALAMLLFGVYHLFTYPIN